MKKTKSKEFIKLCKKYEVDPNMVPEILTYEQACKITKRNPKVDHDDMQKTIIVIEAFCKELKYKVDYDNKNQYKWFPIHKKTSTGLLFSHAHCEYWDSRSYAAVGAPFILLNDDCAKFMGIHFLPLYSWKLNYKVK